MQDCIGVTYTATQSTLELFKLEIDYSSTLFQAKLQDCIGVTYTATQSTLELFRSQQSKIARLHRSHLYSNSINTRTIQARS